VAMGEAIVTRAIECGLDPVNLYIDPVILPLKAAPGHARAVLGALGQLKSLAEPPVNLLVGLSNVSRRCKERALLNRTFLAMCVAQGLNAVIMDALDADLMDAAITAEVLLERRRYRDDYMDVYLDDR
jgi:5-methyltetrahydrofolate corrinoid/iron sulfur protein methyltransferase